MRLVNIRDEPPYEAPGGRLTNVLADEVPGLPTSWSVMPSSPRRKKRRSFPTRRGEQVLVTPTGEEFRLTPGSRLFIPPETMHQHTNPGATAVCFLGIFSPPAGICQAIRTRPIARDGRNG